MIRCAWQRWQYGGLNVPFSGFRFQNVSGQKVEGIVDRTALAQAGEDFFRGLQQLAEQLLDLLLFDSGRRRRRCDDGSRGRGTLQRPRVYGRRIGTPLPMAWRFYPLTSLL